jgi:paraquat-inducible protein A
MLIACSDCGTVQQIHRLHRPGRLLCRRCDCVLERAAGRALDHALALSLATLLLLCPANLMTLFRVTILGVGRSSRLGSGWGPGSPGRNHRRSSFAAAGAK